MTTCENEEPPDPPVPEPTAEEITEHAHNGEIWEPIMRRWMRAIDVAEPHGSEEPQR